LAEHPQDAAQLVLVGAPGMGLAAPDRTPLKGWRHLQSPEAQEEVHRHNLLALMLQVLQINLILQFQYWGYLQCIAQMQQLKVKRLILRDPPTIVHEATFVGAPCPPIVFSVFPGQLLRLIT
jgi:hypothetical protein